MQIPILVMVVIIATVALSLFWLLRPETVRPDHNTPEEPFMIFRHNVLDYASDKALARFPIAMGAHNWHDLHEIFVAEFPDFPQEPPQNPTQNVDLTSTGTPTQKLQVEWINDGASITFTGQSPQTAKSNIHRELEALQKISSSMPYPTWKADQTDLITWQNNAYDALQDRCGTPTKPLFDVSQMTPSQNVARIKIGCDKIGTEEWFEVTRTLLDDGLLYSATSLDPLIRAEDAQRDFVQTLAKTFAHLSVGLAVFNRDRQLALFNPALIDLSGLSVSFLSPRPTIDTFFDAMRENRRMPEPKNYKSWRQRMIDLVDDAELGRFEETWTLETGQTYSVKGRPHPDGAIAFLLEDISAEVSLARNFRAEVELGQNLVDTFEDALAVFSQSGMLTFSNKAYDTMWKFKAGTSFADVTITDAIKLWKDRSEPNPLWQDIHDAVMTLGERETWAMPVCIKGQSPMQCRIVPIASGATVIRFSQQHSVALAKVPILGRNKG